MASTSTRKKYFRFGQDIYSNQHCESPLGFSRDKYECTKSLILWFKSEGTKQYYERNSCRNETNSYKKIFSSSFCIETIIQVLQDACSSKHNGEELPHLDDWKNNSKVMTAPRQQNNDDCGVMVLMFTYFLSIGKDPSFMSDSSKHGVCRWFIALSILDNRVHDIENLWRLNDRT